MTDKINYPKTINLTSDEFEENLFEGIKFPLIIKPRFGNGSINTKKVDDFNYQLAQEILKDLVLL